MVKGRVVEELTRELDHRITFLTSLLALLCLMISMSILSDYHYRYNQCDVGGEEESEAGEGCCIGLHTVSQLKPLPLPLL